MGSYPSAEYKNIRTLPGHDHSVSAVRSIPSSGNLVSASRDKSLRIWDTLTGYCVKTIREHSDWVQDVSPSFDGQMASIGWGRPDSKDMGYFIRRSKGNIDRTREFY